LNAEKSIFTIYMYLSSTTSDNILLATYLVIIKVDSHACNIYRRKLSRESGDMYLYMNVYIYFKISQKDVFLIRIWLWHNEILFRDIRCMMDFVNKYLDRAFEYPGPHSIAS